MYNVACGYALLNDKENAFVWLERALADSFGRADLLRSDSDLDSLRTDARFKKILDSNPKATEKKNASRTPDRLEQANLDFARLTREASQDGSEWHKVGRRLLGLRDLDRSIVALSQAVTLLDYKGSTAMYNLACAYALKGERDAGLNWLEKSINAGFDNNDKVKHDPDINSLRGDARFKRLEKLSRTLSLSQFYGDSFEGSPYSPYSNAQWAPAIALYEWFVQTEPYNGRAWFNLGYALHYSREHARAIEAFEHARQLGYSKPTSIYNIACAYAMLDQRELAFEWLDRAVDAGFDLHGSINGDRDLDNLRPDPRFERFLSTTWYERKDEKTDQ